MLATTLRGELTVTHLSGEPGAWRLARLEHPLLFDVADPVNDLDIGKTVEVPAGFVTDGPSIPRLFWAIMPVWGSWARAGVIHDYLCCRIAMGRPHGAVLTRRDADRAFNRAMRACGVGTISRTLLYIGVRIGTILNVKTTMIGYNEKLRASQEAISS